MKRSKISYKDNPNLKLEVVTTVQGDKEYRQNCRYIKGVYYVIDRDAININDTFYRVNSGKIVLDSEKNIWLLKEQANNLITGIIDVNEKGPVIGTFSPNVFNNGYINTKNGGYPIMNPELCQDFVVENKSKGTYVVKAEQTATYVKNLSVIKAGIDYTNKGYNIEDNKQEFKEKTIAFQEYSPVLSKNAKVFGQLLGNTTFGCELEAAVGACPDHLQYRHGVVTCRDGSLDGGPEFVTVPLEGAKGIQNLYNLSNVLKERCDININCSLHIHTGNIPLTRMYIVALYMLGLKIQDELFLMFPGFKVDPRNIKKKNYCQKLKNLSIHYLQENTKANFKSFVDDAYYKIFTFLSDGVPPDENNNSRVKKHPIKEKWNRPSRYYWLNLQNMIFSERGTAEHRMHTGTLNSTKILNWLFICNAIIRYAEKNIEKIITSPKNISLKEVLDFYKTEYPTNQSAVLLSDYLNAYYNYRKKVFEKDIANGDKISEHEMHRDKEYSFEYKGLASLV